MVLKLLTWLCRCFYVPVESPSSLISEEALWENPRLSCHPSLIPPHVQNQHPQEAREIGVHWAPGALLRECCAEQDSASVTLTLLFASLTDMSSFQVYPKNLVSLDCHLSSLTLTPQGLCCYSSKVCPGQPSQTG